MPLDRCPALMGGPPGAHPGEPSTGWISTPRLVPVATGQPAPTQTRVLFWFYFVTGTNFKLELYPPGFHIRPALLSHGLL